VPIARDVVEGLTIFFADTDDRTVVSTTVFFSP
jgi:hypothetical protein